jgi:hypothetical protein
MTIWLMKESLIKLQEQRRMPQAASAMRLARRFTISIVDLHRSRQC